MSDFYVILTDAGQALMAAATAGGDPVVLSKFGVDDGNGATFTPDPAQTTLINEVYQGDISLLQATGNTIKAQLVIPKDSGGYTVRGFGLYTEDGTLFSVCNFPPQEKPLPSSGYAVKMDTDYYLQVTDTSVVELQFTGDDYLTREEADTIYFQIGNNLSEIAANGPEAQQEARDNLALGTAAVRDVADGDNNPNDLVPVGYKGNFGPDSNHDGIDFSTYLFVVGESLFIDLNLCTNVPPFLSKDYYYIEVISATGPVVGATLSRPLLQLVRYGNETLIFAVRDQDGSAAINWRYLQAVQYDANSNNVSIDGSITVGGDVNATGDIYSDGAIEASTGIYDTPGVRAYSANNPPPVDGVQNIALGAMGSYSVGGGVTEAPPGCVLTGGGDFGSEDGSYAYRAEQITFDGVNWMTVSLLGATRNVEQMSLSDVAEISMLPYDLSSTPSMLSSFTLTDQHISGVWQLSNDDYEWYRIRNNLAQTGSFFIAYHEDTGIIEQIDENVQALWPFNMAVAALDSLPDGCDVFGTWIFDPATMTVSQSPALVSSKNRRGPYQKYLRAASDAYTLLQLVPPDDAAEKLQELKDYLVELQAVDLTQPVPNWPPVPEFIN